MRYYTSCWSFANQHSITKQNRLMTQMLNGGYVMANEQNRASLLGDVSHLSHALALERLIPHRQHFVHEQNLGLQMCCHCERQSHVHAAGVALDRRVEELLDLDRILSRVLLPAPLRPMMPTTSPRLTSKETSRNAQNSVEGCAVEGCRLPLSGLLTFNLPTFNRLSPSTIESRSVSCRCCAPMR